MKNAVLLMHLKWQSSQRFNKDSWYLGFTLTLINQIDYSYNSTWDKLSNIEPIINSNLFSTPNYLYYSDPPNLLCLL